MTNSYAPKSFKIPVEFVYVEVMLRLCTFQRQETCVAKMLMPTIVKL
jgi:hypothetical protein